MKRNSSSRVFYSTIPYKASQIHGTLQLSRIYYAALWVIDTFIVINKEMQFGAPFSCSVRLSV